VGCAHLQAIADPRVVPQQDSKSLVATQSLCAKQKRFKSGDRETKDARKTWLAPCVPTSVGGGACTWCWAGPGRTSSRRGDGDGRRRDAVVGPPCAPTATPSTATTRSPRRRPHLKFKNIFLWVKGGLRKVSLWLKNTLRASSIGAGKFYHCWLT